jgi:hypothetical protein
MLSHKSKQFEFFRFESYNLTVQPNFPPGQVDFQVVEGHNLGKGAFLDGSVYFLTHQTYTA